VAEHAALEKADEALAQCDVLRRERAELRRRVSELEALADPKLAAKVSQSDAAVLTAQRRADVAERQLEAIKSDREELRRRLDEAEKALAVYTGGAGVLPDTMGGDTAPPPADGHALMIGDKPVAAVRDELAGAHARVADALAKLKDREQVLVKVLARSHGIAGGGATAAGAAAQSALSSAISVGASTGSGSGKQSSKSRGGGGPR
jgi:hypothetical protein